MDAYFFVARGEEAAGVASSHDLPGEAAADRLRIADASPLAALASVLGEERGIHPLRDATCRSFPVWRIGHAIAQRLAELDEDGLEDCARDWQRLARTGLDADLDELARCLADLQGALRTAAADERLFVLLEEPAF